MGQAPLLPAVPPRPDRQLVVFLGNSLTAGLGIDPRRSFPSLVQSEWSRRGVPYWAVNEGVSGDRTDDVLARLGSSRAPGAELTVLEIGANDAFWAVPVPQIEANLSRIIHAIVRGGSRVALSPLWFQDGFLPAGDQYTREFNGLHERVGRAEGVSVLPPLLRSLQPEARDWLPDGVHPSAEGHALIARDLLGDLNPEWRTSTDPGGQAPRR